RDALWTSLLDVARTGEGRAMLLRGHAGAGKSRLASWLCRRAHEVGGVSSLRADHEPALPGTEALGRMALRALAVPPATSPAAAQSHALRWAACRGLDEDDARALAAFVRSHLEGGARASAEERHLRLARL